MESKNIRMDVYVKNSIYDKMTDVKQKNWEIRKSYSK